MGAASGKEATWAEGVDAGVGAAGALREDALAGGAVDGVGERALDGGQAGLDLPSVVGGSVVGEGELPVLSWRCFGRYHGVRRSVWLDV
jgi:hypothetical protein